MSKFKNGESVVCIDDDFSWAMQAYRGVAITWPVRGRCYVVRGYAIRGRKPAVLLREIKNPRVPYMDGVTREAGFWDERFARAPKIDGFKKIASDVDQWLGHEDEPDLHPAMDKEDA